MPLTLRNRFLWVCISLCSVIALGACSENMSPPELPQSLTVEGTVVDTLDAPLAGALMALRVFGADTVSDPGAPPSVAITDPAGWFRVQTDSLGDPTIDSVVVTSLAPGCKDPAQRTVISGGDVPPGATPVVQVMIVQAQVRPPARTAPGEYCARGVHPFWGPNSYIFGLRIDSVVAGAFWGRWDLNYGFSSGDDEGTFTGTATTTAVVLELTSDPVWHDCTTMELHAPVKSDGSWGAATIVGAQACLPDPAPFAFAADTIIGLFP